jgi:filamentous hemagglutinin family protein
MSRSHWKLGITTTLYGLATAIGIAVPGVAFANPLGGVVSAGSAVISSSGSVLSVTQSSDRAVIDWRSFDIGVGETTRFIQPSVSSMTLNRVNAATPSMIQGMLTANGHVVLVNPNGIMFTSSAKVDVAGLVATSATISTADFMSGNMSFNQPGSPTASIINAGQITIEQAGLVAFVAPQVQNSGTIEAKLGTVHLGSGDSFTLDMMGDGLVSLAVTDPTVQHQLVSNSGMIRAHGGTVILSAAAAKSVVDSLVNNRHH